jgi:hypothetical protein
VRSSAKSVADYITEIRAEIYRRLTRRMLEHRAALVEAVKGWRRVAVFSEDR